MSQTCILSHDTHHQRCCYKKGLSCSHSCLTHIVRKTSFYLKTKINKQEKQHIKSNLKKPPFWDQNSALKLLWFVLHGTALEKKGIQVLKQFLLEAYITSGGNIARQLHAVVYRLVSFLIAIQNYCLLISPDFGGALPVCISQGICSLGSFTEHFEHLWQNIGFSKSRRVYSEINSKVNI